MTYNVPQFRASYLHRQLMCDNYTTPHATLPITISYQRHVRVHVHVHVANANTTGRAVERPSNSCPNKQVQPPNVPSVCGVHASPSPRTQLSEPRQRNQTRKEIPGSHRTAPFCLSSQNQKVPASQPQRAAHPVQARPGDPRDPTSPANGYRLSLHPGTGDGTGGGIRHASTRRAYPGPAAGFSTPRYLP
jgi:hypothetical protein